MVDKEIEISIKDGNAIRKVMVHREFSLVIEKLLDNYEETPDELEFRDRLFKEINGEQKQ